MGFFSEKIISAIKAVCFLSIAFYPYIKCDAQLTKNNWLVGGSGSLSFKRQENVGNIIVKENAFTISPNVGYFLIDKFAAGITTSYYSVTTRYNSGKVNTQKLNAGPFARYYFLPSDKIFNILCQGKYEWGNFWGDNHSNGTENSFTVGGGPAIFFNSSVALELIMNYEITHTKKPDVNIRKFYLAIGLQVFLEKEK